MLHNGVCPTCGGQVSLGAVSGDYPVDGAVAMTFGAGSRVAVPLDASFEQTRFDHDGAKRIAESKGTQEKAAPAGGGPPGLEPSDLPDDFGASRVPSPPSGEPLLPPWPRALSNEPTSTAAGFGATGFEGEGNPTDEIDTSQIASPNAEAMLGGIDDSREKGVAVGGESSNKVPAFSGDADGAAAGDDFGFGTNPTVEVPAHLKATLVAAAASDDQASEPEAAAPPTAVADGQTTQEEEPAAGVAAHLKLPPIDFSVPDLGFGSSDSESLAPSTAPSTELPAHLQLPSFPDFELPPIPGEEPDKGGDVSNGDAASGGFGGTQPAEAGAGDADTWQLPPAANAAPPPPLPAPRSTKQGLAPSGLPDVGAAPSGGGEALPDLPAFGLPAFDANKSEPTLVQTNVALQLSKDEPGKRSLGSKIAISLIVLLGLAVVGSAATVAVVGVDDAMRWINPPKKRTAAEVRREKADAAYYEGVAKYKEALAAEEAKKKKTAKQAYEAAIAKFNQALEHEQTYGDAHRNLGIVFAKLNKQNQAVKHYRLYLKLKPKAKDKKEVLKIINDYEEAQQKGKTRK